MKDSSSSSTNCSGSNGGNSIQSYLQRRIEGDLIDVTTRPIFDYQYYSMKRKKFFIGFAKKDKTRMIIRLLKDLQEKALQNPKLKNN
jgi:hypothetical protein